MNQNTPKAWEKEFDEIKWIRENDRLQDLENYAQKVKAFISKVETEAERRTEERVKKDIWDWCAKNDFVSTDTMTDRAIDCDGLAQFMRETDPPASLHSPEPTNP